MCYISRSNSNANLIPSSDKREKTKLKEHTHHKDHNQSHLLCSEGSWHLARKEGQDPRLQDNTRCYVLVFHFLQLHNMLLNSEKKKHFKSYEKPKSTVIKRR